MLTRVKQFFTEDVPYIKSALASLLTNRENERTDVRLMRKLLGSISIKPVPLSEMKDTERKDFAASIAIVYPKLRRIIDNLIAEQKDAGYTLENDQMFVKGTLNGMYLVLDEINLFKAEHEENTLPKPKFDEHATLPELLERFSRQSGQPSTTD